MVMMLRTEVASESGNIIWPRGAPSDHGIGRTTRNDQARLTFRSNQYLNQHSDFFAVGDASIHRQIDTLVSWTSGCEVLHICAIACVG